MFGNVTAAETLARHRAADLDRRNELRRRKAERERSAAARRGTVAPSAPGFAAVLLGSLELSRPHTAR